MSKLKFYKIKRKLDFINDSFHAYYSLIYCHLMTIIGLLIFYKIISGVYAARLMKALPDIIRIQQKAYLEGRNITDVTKNIWDTMFTLKTNQKRERET